MAKDKGSSRGDGCKISRDAGSSQFKQSKPKGRDLSRGGGSKIGRDAGSGQFIPVKEAERRPRTAIVETIKQPKPKGRDLDSVAQAWEALRDSSGIGPIRNEADYDERVALLNSLIDTVRDDEAHPLAGLMEIVGDLVENYENTYYSMPEAEPREALRFLMEEHGLKQGELPEIGSQGIMSEILAGKRAINARQAKLLAARFGVSAAVFI
ncbi:MAG: helix-turn-helix domain-containing protein [bacterium]